ncbi:hypothetical protein [Flavobacterium sp.]|uniref:hypothetical protein n=1 Tax=Flavobacterium sp. TaxID=239 RepID=UPI003797F85B
MKKLILLSAFFVIFLSMNSYAQDQIKVQEKYTAHNKGKFFVSWGGNRDIYSKSTVNFRGANYNFTVANMVSHDKPKGWNIDYINPLVMTTPQTNFRMGYFISDHYSIAVGIDHMKYVMTQDQTANVSGYIDSPLPHAATYINTPTVMSNSFLMYEHTDGLNYINTEFSRHDDFSSVFKIKNTDKIQVNLTEGVGVGLLYPKTNTTLLGKPRHDDFHVSGYGASVKAGLNITFLKYFYIQGELKEGYINMPDIRTTQSAVDRASQHFLFFERSIAFGGIFKI